MSGFSFNLLKITDPSRFRLGQLIFSRNKQEKILDTPNCFVYTMRGSVPHLTPDNLQTIPVDSLGITLEHFLEAQPPASTHFMGGIHKFLNLEDYLLFFDVRDSGKLQHISFNTDKYVSVVTNQGCRKVTVEEYVRYMNAYNPDIFASIADLITDKNPSLKRVKKSVDRTLNWLDETLEQIKEGIHVFGVVTGHDKHEERMRSAQETANRNVAGFVLNGFDLDITSKERLDLMKISLNHLPKNKPRVAYGLGAPEYVLLGIFEGIDIFDTSYPSEQTSLGHALTFLLLENGIKNEQEKFIDLWDNKYRTDFRPILNGCKCYACQNHTRAYIFHLLAAHEMLATVLLMSHNLFHYLQFFKDIRKSINNNTFTNTAMQFIRASNITDE
ncbi:17728_t:CDS:2 [Gigaspora margarita]|uniref:Queuine tRNA-ribosyltransferase accessory subunit 2 n=1 Tax=Gigaspora margarita TaxID=4874 RepID=A0ABN7UJG3_GIGMA|nr:17728_t:CDS:2 [Gigaspora margarita]